MQPEALNVPAVIAGAIAAFLLGAVVYHPKVLGRTWAEGSDVTLNDGARMGAIVVQALALCALAIVVGITATFSLLGAAIAAILAVALFLAASGMFLGKSTGAIAIDARYAIGAGILMIAAQGIL